MEQTAQIAVEGTAFHFDRLFDYRVPPELSGRVRRGVRVLVPFGKGNRKIQGLVFRTAEAEEAGRKPVLAVLDEEPVIGEEGFRIVEFLAETTFCSYYDALKCLLPAGLDHVVREEFRLVRMPEPEELELLSPEERLVLEAVSAASSQREINRFFSEEDVLSREKAARSLTERGIFTCTDLLKPRVRAKTVRMVRLSGKEPLPALTPKQREVVRVLRENGPLGEKDAAYRAGVREGVLKTLAQKGVIEYYDQEVYRTPRVSESDGFTLEELTLSEEHQRVYEGNRALCERGEPSASLLFGVTGSGKTQIFIKLIQDCLADGKGAMLLVPEISLTPQLLSKFQRLFGEKIAIIHSGLSMGERLDAYQRVRTGAASIVIGTRSAVFAPFRSLGLIILDEEGEHSYKSESAPRYHARDVAKLRCVYHNAALLLASATPSIESYYAAQKGRYHLFTLRRRYGAAALPDVRIVDMREEAQNGNTSPLSDSLAERLLQTWQRKEQSILLINRRGYAAFALCMDCGEPVRCPNCSITLTYHKANGCLMCHYCGYTSRADEPCPSCGGKHLDMVGTGTQKVEDILAKRIPDARILRMDADAVTSRYAYEENFSRFEAGEYDILIGTQMVAKGLNFPNVTLVGVLNSDQSLYANDYRCGEKTFSLITQVVGRSGRGDKPGEAYIQTVSPENTVILDAARQDYEAFYRQEIAVRKATLQPPFCDLAVVGFSGAAEDRTRKAAQDFHRVLRDTAMGWPEKLPLVLLGVSQAGVYRVNGRYRYRIVMKCRSSKKFRAMLRSAFMEASKRKIFSRVSVFVDINGEIL